MQEKIQELENHINLLVGEISLLKAEIKSKSTVEYAETLANEAKSLAVIAEARAKRAFDAFISINDKLYFRDNGLKSNIGNFITTEIRNGQARVHEYDLIHLSGNSLIANATIKSSHVNTIASEIIQSLEFKEFSFGKGRLHEYDKGNDFFVGAYQEKSPDKLVSAVYSNGSRTSVTMMADKITFELNGGK